MAAQSIGEPGTQLTMRTFNTGGVAGDDITQGLPRVQELFEARNPKGKATIAEINGVVTKIEDDNGKYIIHIKNDVETRKHITNYNVKLNVVEGQEVEQGTVVGIQGGDPNRDPNPGYSTGSHLHFEIRMSQNGDFVNPREYLYGEKEV